MPIIDKPLIANVKQALAERSCGDCKACCGPGIGVEGMKAEQETCKNLCAAGCAIYETRPDDCREWHCLWRAGFGRNMERPDRVGYFLDITGEGNAIGMRMMVAREARPGAFDETGVREALGKLSRDKLILLVKGDSRNVIGPPALVKRVQDRMRIIKLGKPSKEG